MRRTAAINWNASTLHGWGVYGLNLALNWAADPDVAVVSATEMPPSQLSLDPLSRRVLGPFLAASAELRDQLSAHAGGRFEFPGPVLLPLNARMISNRAAHDVELAGAPTLGVVFMERSRLEPAAVERAAALELLVAGSSWNERVLREHGLNRVRTILQGIEPSLFRPAPRRGLLGDRFAVFSGGKLERRKGQDLVVAAFRIFAARHPEALLVSAWHSPWPQVARSLDVSGLAAPVPFEAGKLVDVGAWTAASGVPADQFLDLGLVANSAMPAVLREMEVALFPNRCEGGTNLVAMECLACGVPTILSRNTGHFDLTDLGVGYPLASQRPLQGAEEGWGESDIAEIVAALEAIHADREAARARALKDAEAALQLTWARTAAQMKTVVLEAA